MDTKKKRTKAEMIALAEKRSEDYGPDSKLTNEREFMEVKKSDIRTIRIDDQFLLEIKKAAEDDGFSSYQAYIKYILRNHLKKHKQA